MFHEPDSSIDLLASWRWLLGGHPRLLGWSSAGDLFVVNERGAVARLDTGNGEAETVAETADDFQRGLLAPEWAEKHLLLSVVRQFESTHGPLGSDECLGFTSLPILGGTYTTENRIRLSIVEHARVTGDMHRQLRDLPDGTQVSVRIVP